MINLIYANGCSHTAGAEIEGDFAGDCTRKSFPAKIANYYNCNVINDALSGGSCDRVVRTTLEFVEHYKIDKKDTSKLFIIIGWPGYHRTEIKHNGWIIPLCASTFTNKDPDWIPNNIKHWFVNGMSVGDEDFMIYKIQIQILLMQEYLKSQGIKFLFFSAWQYLPAGTLTDSLIFDSISEKTFYRKDSNYNDLMLKQGFQKRAGHHF